MNKYQAKFTIALPRVRGLPRDKLEKEWSNIVAAEAETLVSMH